MNSDIYKPCLGCSKPVNVSLILIQQRTNIPKNIFCVGSLCAAKYHYYHMKLRKADAYNKKFFPELGTEVFDFVVNQREEKLVDSKKNLFFGRLERSCIRIS